MIGFSEDMRYVVTGAGSGIGKAIAVQLLELGATVIGIGRNESKLIPIKEQFANFHYRINNLSENIDEIPKLIDGIVNDLGKLSGMALCAGIQETKPISVAKYENAKALFDTNYFSNMMLIKGFAKKVNFIPSVASIIAISSVTTHLGVPGISNYSASKAAMNSLVKSLSMELAKNGIRLNSISPGHILTEMITKSPFYSDSYVQSLEQRYPLGLGKPEDVANLAMFLLSDKSTWITGTDYIIDGGLSINF